MSALLRRRLGEQASGIIMPGGSREVLCLPVSTANSVWFDPTYTHLLVKDDGNKVICRKDDDNERQIWNFAPPGVDVASFDVHVTQQKYNEFTDVGDMDINVDGVTSTKQGIGIQGMGELIEDFVLTFNGPWTAAELAALFQIAITSGTDSGVGEDNLSMLQYDNMYAIAHPL